MPYKIVDTHSPDYPLVDGTPYNKYDAGAELIFQLEKFFPGMFVLEEISSREGTGGMKESLFRCTFTPEETSGNHFYIYALEIESGGRDNSYEHRVQFRHNTQWNPKLADLTIMTQFCQEKGMLNNKECYVIGMTKHDPDDHDVIFSSFHPSNLLSKDSKNIETEAISPKSIQVKVQFIQDAYLNDISCQHKGDNFNVINYRPQYFLWYMANRDELHFADIQTVNDLIKKARTESYFRPVPQTPASTDNIQEMVISAIRTKPFLLIAGISGTGKSRIVRELAFKSCPKYLQDKDGTTPGNYCMIEVKPNWHDSTELLGYYSNLNMSYQFKKFVKFLVKAKMNPDVPFFVCLDEMNLAPVEQYFAEILSVLETRKHPKKDDGDEIDMRTIKTGAIIGSEFFERYTWKGENGQKMTRKEPMTDRDWYFEFFNQDTMSDGEKAQANKYLKTYTLGKEGLTLPDNVVIIGTVNMDDTTHQFSRKVIDRAMTIEMNGGKLRNMFGGSKALEYANEEEQEKWQKSFYQRYVNADEVLLAHAEIANDLIDKIPDKLETINKSLNGTPFEVSYRVQNELTIMVGVMLDDISSDYQLDDVIDQALDRILLMKILPRIEGDSEMFALKKYITVGDVTCKNRLEWLRELSPNIKAEEGDDNNNRMTARMKIDEMIGRLNNQEFTRFWP